MNNFEEIWEKYPMKDGKKSAQKSFQRSVRTTADWIQINQALDNYLAHLRNNDCKKPKNGSTWFNGWQDWINWKEPGRGELDEYRKKMGLVNG